MSDIDLGELFLNFPLNHQLREFAGTNVTAIKDRVDKDIPLTLDEVDGMFLYKKFRISFYILNLCDYTLP